MTGETRRAGGVLFGEAPHEGHAIDVTPLNIQPIALLRGEWVTAPGGGVSKRGDYAVLRSGSGNEVLLDRTAVELACVALGLELKR